MIIPCALVKALPGRFQMFGFQIYIILEESDTEPNAKKKIKMVAKNEVIKQITERRS